MLFADIFLHITLSVKTLTKGEHACQKNFATWESSEEMNNCVKEGLQVMETRSFFSQLSRSCIPPFSDPQSIRKE